MISSRQLLFALCAVNLLALTWWTGGLAPLLDSVREPHRLNSQIEPDRMTLSPSASIANPAKTLAAVDSFDIKKGARLPASADAIATVLFGDSPNEWQGVQDTAGEPTSNPTDADALNSSTEERRPVVASAPTARSANEYVQKVAVLGRSEESAETTATAETDAEPPVGKTTVAGAAPSNVCARVAEINFIILRKLRSELAEIPALLSSSRDDAGNYLVFLEPFASYKKAKIKEKQLRSLGVRELHIIQVGYYKNGISLGLLRTAERAQKHLEHMTTRGVKDILIGPVNARSSRYQVTVHATASVIDNTLRPFAKQQGLSLASC